LTAYIKLIAVLQIIHKLTGLLG